LTASTLAWYCFSRFFIAYPTHAFCQQKDQKSTKRHQNEHLPLVSAWQWLQLQTLALPGTASAASSSPAV
jgi:hypothetical protein